jgi:hypothetical protein
MNDNGQSPSVAAPHSPVYETPWHVEEQSECMFYHKINLPGLGEVGGDWDIRACADAYLGNHDFTGKRVLDVGAASGFLTFEMEKKGADVVSFDMDDGERWDVVPHYKIQPRLPQIISALRQSNRRLKNGYWLAHRLLGSKARASYGNIYSMDARLGEFDVVYYGMIIGHLRDVFQALYQGAMRCRETMIVTSVLEKDETPRATFAPHIDYPDRIYAWWAMTTGTVKSMLNVLGFKTIDIVESNPLVDVRGHTKGPWVCQTVVARKI